jgi:hypothetical protein
VKRFGLATSRVTLSPVTRHAETARRSYSAEQFKQVLRTVLRFVAEGRRASHRNTAQSASVSSPAVAVVSEWPEQMVRDLKACKTPLDYRLWAIKWADELSGSRTAIEKAIERHARREERRKKRKNDD